MSYCPWSREVAHRCSRGRKEGTPPPPDRDHPLLCRSLSRNSSEQVDSCPGHAVRLERADPQGRTFKQTEWAGPLSAGFLARKGRKFKTCLGWRVEGAIRHTPRQDSWRPGEQPRGRGRRCLLRKGRRWPAWKALPHQQSRGVTPHSLLHPSHGAKVTGAGGFLRPAASSCGDSGRAVLRAGLDLLISNHQKRLLGRHCRKWDRRAWGGS